MGKLRPRAVKGPAQDFVTSEQQRCNLNMVGVQARVVEWPRERARVF